MTELDQLSPFAASQSSNIIEVKTEAVTAARRYGNLEAIRKQSGWESFPSCIPTSMRTTKSGKVTEYGNTKLRIIKRIAVSTDFDIALEFLRELTEGGERLLSLKDLEECAAHFDRGRKGQSCERGGSNFAPASTVVSEADESEPIYQYTAQPLNDWNNFTRDQGLLSLHIGTSTPTLKRASPEGFQSTSGIPVVQKRLRMDTFFEGQYTDYPLDTSEHELNHMTNLAVSQGYHQQSNTNMRAPSSSMPQRSPSSQNPANPARALLSIYPYAGSTLSNLNTAFDDLLARVKDQQQLVRTAFGQYRLAKNGLSAASRAINTTEDRDLETGLSTAQRNEARAKHGLEQAKSARDVIDIQYGHISTSHSRALVDIVRAEYTKAGVAMIEAQADVEAARQRLKNANNRKQVLQRTKEVAEVGIDELQRHTRFWLKRLAEIRVELTDQLGTLGGVTEELEQVGM